MNQRSPSASTVEFFNTIRQKRSLATLRSSEGWAGEATKHQTQLRRDPSICLIFEFAGSRAAFTSAASTDKESFYFRAEDFWRGIVSLTFQRVVLRIGQDIR